MSPARRSSLVLVAIVVLAAALRFVDIGRHSMWLDEVSSLADSESFTVALSRVFHPPLYYVLLWAWRALCGDSDAAVRTLSALCGTGVVVVVERIGRALPVRGAALVAAFLVAIEPLALWFSREARMYSLWMLLICGAVLAALALADGTRTRRHVLAYQALVALALLTHHWTAIYGTVLAAAVLVVIGPHAWRKSTADVRAWLVIHLPLLAFSALLIGRMALTRVASAKQEHASLGDFLRLGLDGQQGSIPATLAHLVVFENWAYEGAGAATIATGCAVLGALALSAAVVWRRPGASDGDRRALVLVVAVTLIPIVLMQLLPVRGYTRLMAPSAALLALPIAAAVCCCRGPRLGALGSAAAIAAIVLVLGRPILHVYQREIEPWRAVCDALATQAEPGAVVLVTARYAAKPLLHCLSDDTIVTVVPYPDAGVGLERLPALTRGSPQVWIVVSHADDPRTADVELRSFALLAATRPLLADQRLGPLIRVVQLGASLEPAGR